MVLTVGSQGQRMNNTTLKRKRDTLAGASSSRRTSPDASDSTLSSPTNSRRSADIHRDSPSTDKGDVVRTQLKLSLSELHTTSIRLRTLLDQFSPSHPHASRTALTELQAPAQTSLHASSSHISVESAPLKRSLQNAAKSCSTCKDLQQQISQLEQKVKEHDKEREAWKAFKQWWLTSLSKREKSSQNKRRKNGIASNALLVSRAENKDADEGLEKGMRVANVAQGLNRATKQVWVRAGIISDEGLRDEGADRSREIVTVETREREQSSKSGGGGGSAGQQSEFTLPLHAAILSPAKPLSAVSKTCSRTTGDVPNKVMPVPAEGKADSASSETTALSTRTPATIISAIRPSATLRHTITKPSHARRINRDINLNSDTGPSPRSHVDVGYVDTTPMRNRLARRAMYSSDCPDCEMFYSHFDHLDSNLNSRSRGEDGAGAGEVERMACSRHRSTYKRATTPEGYWNIGFPTTQEAEEVNALARKKRQQNIS